MEPETWNYKMSPKKTIVRIPVVLIGAPGFPAIGDL